jgi:hypothetical protein
MPRALELVQFLSIYCTLLSSRQQSRVSDFQVASFTQLSMSQKKYCRVCPGSCIQPSVLLLPTSVLMLCLFAAGAAVAAFDAYNARNPSSSVPAMQDRLLEAGAALSAAAVDGRSSLRHTIAAFCVRYFRGMIETFSSYVIMPCTFVFVLNLRPSSFDQLDSSQRAMMFALPVVMLLLRALVIRRGVVRLTAADQRQLYVGSACSCLIAAVVGVYFEQAHDVHLSSPSFASQTTPQGIVLSLLAVQVIAQTVIRLKATEESFFDNTQGSVKSASSTAAISAAKFILLNHVPLSQMAMVVAGLASSGSASPPSIEASSVVIGCIPLVTCGSLLLHNIVKLVAFFGRKWCGRRKRADAHSRDIREMS